jgi:hypothetical protein
MEAFNNRMMIRKQGEKLFHVKYQWKNDKYLEAYCYMKTEAGAIARTFNLALARGFGTEPDSHKVDSYTDLDTWSAHTVYTNAIHKLKNSRSLSANDKREALAAIQKELINGLWIDEDEIKKLGRIIR